MGQRHYVTSFDRGVPMVWQETQLVFLTMHWLWAALTPLIFAVGRRVPIRRVPLHIAIGTVVATVYVTLLAVIVPLFPWTNWQRFSFDERFRGIFAREAVTAFLIYAILIGVQHTLALHRRDHERQLMLRQAKLDALELQLQPHFLFNTLNTIAVQMRDDPEGANRMLARLGELLRAALDHPGEVTLRDELAFLESYLEIERTRFGGRLTVEIDAPPETHAARVPALLLQPLVENAIRHGIATKSGPGRIEVSAARSDDRIELQVRDDGPGLDAQASRGIGLANTSARLETLYQDRHRFELANREGGGVAVTVMIPYRV
jgi:sensor histidine kinase YesM